MPLQEAPLRIVPLEHVDRIVEENRDQLEALLRYDRYRVLDEETPEEWIRLLGPDVLSLTHPAVTAAITIRFADYNERHGIVLSDEEKIIFFTTPWIHDFGELKVNGRGPGDVSFSLRTAADEEAEAEIFHLIVQHVGDIQARALFERAYDTVAMDRDTKLGRMFNAVEQIGYLLTAIRTYRGVDGKRIINWDGLAGNVLSHQIEKLLAYASEYPYVAEVLRGNEKVITEMFAAIREREAVSLDREGRPFYDHTLFVRAHDAWETRNNSVVLWVADSAVL